MNARTETEGREHVRDHPARVLDEPSPREPEDEPPSRLEPVRPDRVLVELELVTAPVELDRDLEVRIGEVDSVAMPPRSRPRTHARAREGRRRRTVARRAGRTGCAEPSVPNVARGLAGTCVIPLRPRRAWRIRHSQSSFQVASDRRRDSSSAASARKSSSTAAHTSRTVRATPVTGIANRRVLATQLERQRLVIPDAGTTPRSSVPRHRHVDDTDGPKAVEPPEMGRCQIAKQCPVDGETHGHRSRLPRQWHSGQSVHARVYALPLADLKAMVDRPLASAVGDHLRPAEHAVLRPRQPRRDHIDVAHAPLPLLAIGVHRPHAVWVMHAGTR